MGATKLGAYTEEQKRIAAITKALAHPARIAILQELAKQNNCQCGKLADIVGLAQPTVSQHLKELKNAGLIKGTIDESRACYCLSGENLNELSTFVNELKNAIELQLVNCC
jgi:DNA-binding transcriptional ArsR family regulator